MANSLSLVLVVDDQNSNLQLISELLDRAGYQVMPALSGEQALARAEVRPPDLVLLDMAMPGMSGAETCNQLHKLPGLESVPVLFVTGAADRSSMVRAFEAGAVDYITKPFLAEELLARVRTHLELKRARDRLTRMVREREDVIDVVAHDLKNPLTCVLFAAQALRCWDPAGGSPERVEELAQEVLDCADEALMYIQRFLSRGAQEQRLRQFGAHSLSLRDVAVEAARLQRTAAQSRGQHFVVEGDAPAWADALALRNVIQNLLSNAIRYSQEGGRITVRIGPSRRAGYSLCSVEDTGTGVPPEIERQLFQRHVRKSDGPDNAQARYSSGLGLAIAKHDVVQMGGNLWYQRGENGGSVFVIELPQTSPDASSPADETARG